MAAVIGGLVGVGVGALVGNPIGGAIGGAALGAALGAMASEAVDQMISEGIAGLSNTIGVLQGEAKRGASIWYVQSIWQGHAGKHGQIAGSTNFIEGTSSYVPPLAAYYEVGYDMRAECSDYAASQAALPQSPWGPSGPGVRIDQDSNYTGNTIAGCAAVG